MSEVTLLATERDVAQARDFVDAYGIQPGAFAVKEPDGGFVEIPGSLTRMVAQILERVSRGGAVTIGAWSSEVTTTTAAKMLGMSRPTLMKMVAQGLLPAHKVGTHTRLRREDVLAHRDRQLGKCVTAFHELRDRCVDLDADA